MKFQIGGKVLKTDGTEGLYEVVATAQDKKRYTFRTDLRLRNPKGRQRPDRGGV
jgi:hypothetical protein